MPAGVGLKAEGLSVVRESGVKGGFVVHLGCGNGKTSAELKVNDSYIVHGLDVDMKNIKAAREMLLEDGRYGSVSFEQLNGDKLPYVDNLVNLLVVEERGDVSEAEMKRVLAPLGAIVEVKDGKAKRIFRKPWPANIDGWTHYLYDASHNAVAKDDLVAPPKQIRWRAGPQWARTHDHLASISALVSDQGRIFYIYDEAPAAMAALPSQWALIARDAFSGVFLWKRPIEKWEGHLRGFRTGPTELQRRLVAVGDRVYVTLGYGEPVTALDAVTGHTVQTYEQTSNALELVVHDNKLIAVLGDREPQNVAGQGRSIKRSGTWMHWSTYKQAAPLKKIVAIDLKNGKTLWERSGDDAKEVLPMSTIASGNTVYFQNYEQLIAVDASTGKTKWKAERTINRKRPAWSTPTVVVAHGVVISADRSTTVPPDGAPKKESSNTLWLINSDGGHAPDGEMIAFAAEDGKKLWQAPCGEGFNAPVDILIVDGLVWSGKLVQKDDPGIVRALDIKTGEVKRTRAKDQTFFKFKTHHRCFRNKATTRYLVLGRDGTEYVDVKSGKLTDHHWFRGMCQYGVMPANGLTYSPPHSCACHIESKLDSFLALSAKPLLNDSSKPQARLIKGKAYGQKLAASESPSANWPTYRQNGLRYSKVAGTLPQKPKQSWAADLGGDLSQPVIAGNQVYVACKETYSVHALNADDGKKVWTFTAGAKIDSPPTISKGRVVFGCYDGWIYCLRASDGAVIWRYLAAPANARILSDGRPESPWPIHGSVLIQGNTIYAAVGRTPFLEGGLQVCRLKLDTGELLSSTPVKSRSLPDVLSTDGTHLFMRHVVLNKNGQETKQKKRHLYSSAGFLDGNWWHRTYWQYGDSMAGNFFGWFRMANVNIAGRILASDGKTIYGYGRHNQYSVNGSHVGMGKVRNQLFSVPMQPARRSGAIKSNWTKRVPIWVRGMVLADKALLIAGPPDLLEEPKKKYNDPYTLASKQNLQAQCDSLAGKKGASLCAVDLSKGTVLHTLKLTASPVWDGMAAANGRIYISLTNGQVVCCEK
jgi:outer membrane protein assembly factor BamB